MYAEQVRGGSKRKRAQLFVCLGALITSGLAYASLELLETLNWSRPVVIFIDLIVCIVPAALLLTRFLEAQLHIGLRDRTHEITTYERDMLRTVVDSLPDFIYMKDKDGRFLLANKFCCDAMGAPFEQLVGKTDFDFYPPAMARAFHDDEQAMFRSGEPVLGRQEDLVTHDGRALTILTSKIPFKDDLGRIIGLIGIGRDISRRVEAETKARLAQEEAQAEMRERERMAIDLRLAQKLESVGRLAAGLAHEINTPIQYVGDSVYFLKSAFDDLSTLFTAYREAAIRCAQADEETLVQLKARESAADYDFLVLEVPRAFERTLEGVQRVAGIVRAMKEFAHPDTNEHKPADINHALQTTLTVARSEYRYAAQVETRFDEIPEVLCNIGELNQVFLNLVVNSAHAIADTGKDATTGVIKIATTAVADEVRISIADNGCGIPSENVEKIFDPFFTTKEVGRGTGQGLAIARSIVVDKHGGRIDVASEVGSGTEFVISLPVQGRACKQAN